MKKNAIFKVVGLTAMGIAAISIGIAVAARVRKVIDEQGTAKAIIDAEVVGEENSGIRGKKSRRPISPTRGKTSRVIHNLDIFSTSATSKKMCRKAGQETAEYPDLVPCGRWDAAKEKS